MYIRDTLGTRGDGRLPRSGFRSVPLGRLTIRRVFRLFFVSDARGRGPRAWPRRGGRRARARAHKALVAAGAGARGPAAAPACRRARRLTCPLVDRVLPRVGVCPGGPRGGVCTDPAARRPRVREGGGVARAGRPGDRRARPPQFLFPTRLALGRFLAVARGARRGSATGRPYPYERDVTPAQCGERAHGRRKTGPTLDDRRGKL